MVVPLFLFLFLFLQICTFVNGQDVFDPRVFNVQFYSSIHFDLQVAYSNDIEAYRTHWRDSGIAEGRQGVATFSVQEYKRKNSDLASMSNLQLVQHYLSNGYNEGRRAYYQQANRYTLVGSQFALSASRLYGGAVDSIYHNNVEYIQCIGYWRHLQNAIALNGYSECYRPTEAGSLNDAGSGTSTDVRDIIGTGNSELNTRAYPAYYLYPGKSAGCGSAINTERVSNYYLTKKIVMNFRGLANVARYDASILIPNDVRLDIQGPVMYMNYGFTIYGSYNTDTQQIVSLTNAYPSIARLDDNHVIALYDPTKTARYGAAKTGTEFQSTTVIVLNRGMNVAAGTTVSYYTYIIVGTLNEVTTSINQLKNFYEIDCTNGKNGGCDNRTTCTNSGLTRTCGACPTGYSGSGSTACTDINECSDPDICGRGYSCVNTVGSYNCIDINECLNTSICARGYNCSNYNGGYSCTDFNECNTPGACASGYNCTNTPGDFQCSPFCSGGCQNGGTCVEPSKCNCTYLYTGSSCTTAVCIGGCLNGGTCNNGVCSCVSGYNGTNCEKPICNPGCENGGKCVSPYTCNCTGTGYRGDYCTIAECNSGCVNGACVSPNNCSCTLGYTGSSCNTPICTPSCKNGGICVSPNVCNCTSGYEGSSCETPTCSPTCSNGGTCNAPNNCSCTAQYSGQLCTIPVCASECTNACIAPNICGEGPVIYSASSAPTDGGPVVISGINFAGATPNVMIDTYTCTVSSFSNTVINCNLTTVSGKGGMNLYVWVQQDSYVNSAYVFSYLPPYVDSISKIQTTGGLVTIIGGNFGTSFSTANVTIDGKPCPIDIISHKRIVCNLPSGAGAGLPLKIAINGQEYNTLYTYEAPSITDVSFGVPTSGGLLNITGTGFGTSNSQLVVTIGSSTVSCSITTPHTGIMCAAPSGVGNVTLQVQVAGQNSASNSYRIYLGPTVTNITPTDSVGGPIMITGDNFGSQINAIQVFIDNTLCSSLSISTPHKVLTCVIGPGTRRVSLDVIVGGYAVNITSSRVYNSPLISSVSSVGTRGGNVTVTGNNFGNQLSGIEVSCNMVAITHQQITCSVGPGTGKFTISLTTDNILFIFTEAHYAYPKIEAISAVGTAGGNMNITGDNFGSSAQNITVEMNGIEVAFILSEPHTSILAEAEPGTGNVNVSVTVSGLNTLHNFAYSVPVVNEVSSVPTIGGIITVIGDNFGESSSLIAVDLLSCTNVQVTTPHKAFTCLAESGVGANKSIGVTVNGLHSEKQPIFSYFGPQISTITQVSTLGGYINISGSNFGTNTSYVNVNINNQSCNETTLLQPDSIISCFAHAGTGGLNVEVIVAGQSTSRNSSYMGPTLLSASPLPHTGGIVTLTGSNFGENSAVVSVMINDTILCARPSASQYFILCYVSFDSTPYLFSNNVTLKVQVTIDGQSISVDHLLSVYFADYSTTLFTSTSSTTSSSTTSSSTTGPDISSAPFLDKKESQRRSIYLKWTDPVLFDVSLYEIQMLNGTSWDRVGTATNATVKGLEAERLYSFRIHAIDEDNISSDYLYVNQSTLNKDVPGQPTQPRRTRYARDYITVTWQPHEDDGGVILDYYTLEYSFANSTTTSINIPYPTNSYTLEGLEVSTAVDFKVRSHNSLGYSNSSQSSFTSADKFCGDGICDSNEDCSSCYVDCPNTCQINVCTNDCSKHGQCIDGICKCDNGWAGVSCGNPTAVPPVVIVNNTVPNVIIGENTKMISFSISFVSISEKDNSGKILNEYALEVQNITLKADNNTFTYSISLPNGAEIQIFIAEYDNATEIIFANQTIYLGANSLKYSMKVTGWPFVAIQNKLNIIMRTNTINDNNECTETTISANSGSQLKWITLNYAGVILDYAEIDDKVRNVQFSYQGDGDVAIVIPHFWDSAEFDPDFQVLLGDEPETTSECGNKIENEKSKNLTGPIVGGVVGGVVACALAVTGALYWNSKKNKRKLYRMSSSIQMESTKSEL